MNALGRCKWAWARFEYASLWCSGKTTRKCRLIRNPLMGHDGCRIQNVRVSTWTFVTTWSRICEKPSLNAQVDESLGLTRASSTAMHYVCKQRMFCRYCASAQTRLILSLLSNTIPKSSGSIILLNRVGYDQTGLDWTNAIVSRKYLPYIWRC